MIIRIIYIFDSSEDWISMNNEDIPLTEDFYRNPQEYMQLFVRNLNNEIFLSEYHINNLYALLLIGRGSPWDSIRGNSQTTKQQIDNCVNQKVHDVKAILQTLSNLYEDRAKKCAINQIQKLMGILKSKKKSIYIEKDKTALNFKNLKLLQQIARLQKSKEQQILEQVHEPQTPMKFSQAKQQNTGNMINEEQQIRQKQERQKTQQKQIKQPQPDRHCQECQRQEKMQIQEPHCQQQKQQQPKQSNEVFSIFYGLSNLSNLSALALTNILQYNSSERYIKFKMSQSYNMKIKSEDPFYFDQSSSLSSISSDLYVNHIFRFLTASELFNVRSVCKQWLQNVKQTWHSTFKRQMFVQLLACQFCKDIQFYYKMIQLRNPFFQKLSLLIHALIEIIQWQNVYQSIENNTLSLQLKRILIIILRLTGEPIPLINLNSINDDFFNQHKHKLMNLKQRAAQFFSSLSGSDLSINDLRIIKTNFLDDPFMRIQQVNSEDKSPLLLTLFAKQMNLQQILRNHIFLCQEYLLNSKKRLDNISRKMVYQKGYLQGVYKILLLKTNMEPIPQDLQQQQMPQFHQMLQSIFMNKNSNLPDFVIKTKSKSTQIYLDNATKLDLILSTVYSLEDHPHKHTHRHAHSHETGSIKQHTKQDEFLNQASCLRQNKNQIISQVDLKIQLKSQQSENNQNRQNDK